jgi:hypothetical protein
VEIPKLTVTFVHSHHTPFHHPAAAGLYFTMASFSIFTLFVALRLFLLASAAPAPGFTPAVLSERASSYWVSSIKRQGTVAFGTSVSTYLYLYFSYRTL